MSVVHRALVFYVSCTVNRAVQLVAFAFACSNSQHGPPHSISALILSFGIHFSYVAKSIRLDVSCRVVALA